MIKCPYMEGHWYMDDNLVVYIVPNDNYGLAETYGPDGAVLDAINEHHRVHKHVDGEAAARKLHLYWVPSWQRRGNIESGFFAA